MPPGGYGEELECCARVGVYADMSSRALLQQRHVCMCECVLLRAMCSVM